MWLLIIFIFFILFGAWACSDDQDLKYFGCTHNYEYEGDSFSEDDQHYGRYYTCSKCGKKIFICYHNWDNMRDCDPKRFEYWKNRPYSQGLKNYIKEKN